MAPVDYEVMLKGIDEGFSVSVPGLPGCWSQGDTEEEALENIGDAIREYLAVREAPSRLDVLSVCDVEPPA